MHVKCTPRRVMVRTSFAFSKVEMANRLMDRWVCSGCARETHVAVRWGQGSGVADSRGRPWSSAALPKCWRLAQHPRRRGCASGAATPERRTSPRASGRGGALRRPTQRGGTSRKRPPAAARVIFPRCVAVVWPLIHSTSGRPLVWPLAHSPASARGGDGPRAGHLRTRRTSASAIYLLRRCCACAAHFFFRPSSFAPIVVCALDWLVARRRSMRRIGLSGYSALKPARCAATC